MIRTKHFKERAKEREITTKMVKQTLLKGKSYKKDGFYFIKHNLGRKCRWMSLILVTDILRKTLITCFWKQG